MCALTRNKLRIFKQDDKLMSLNFISTAKITGIFLFSIFTTWSFERCVPNMTVVIEDRLLESVQHFYLHYPVFLRFDKRGLRQYRFVST